MPGNASYSEQPSIITTMFHGASGEISNGILSFQTFRASERERDRDREIERLMKVIF